MPGPSEEVPSRPRGARRGPRPGPPPRGVDLRPLVVAAAGVTCLVLLDVIPAWAGLAHHTALPPLDLLADVRLLMAEAPSYPWFAAGLVVVLVARSMMMAAMLGALDRRGVAWCGGLYGAALLPALVAAVLGFAGVAVLYAQFVWVALVVAVVTLLVMGPWPWTPAGRRRSARRGVLAYLGVLLALSLASALGDATLQVALVWVSAGATAVFVRRLAAVAAPDRSPVGRAAVVPVALGAAVALLVIVPAVVVSPSERSGPAGPRDGTLFLVPGLGAATGTSSMFGFDPDVLGFSCEQTAYFSYAGPGDGAPQRDARCPITTGAPYRAEDTRRPIGELAASFRDQVAELAPPVVVVAHSQGAWVTVAGIEETVAPDVGAAVLISAFPRHERGYVLDGPGAGVVGTDGVEVLTSVLRSLDATSFHPRAPLAREHLGTRGAIRDLMDDEIPPGLRVATVTSAFDLPVMGRDWRLDGAVDMCPVYVHHGGLPFSAAAQAQIRGFLDGRDRDPCGWWRLWPTKSVTAFGVPGG